MDLYENVKPQGVPVDCAYLLEKAKKDCTHVLYGVFDCLEGAMHALDHFRLYESVKWEVGEAALVSRIRRNTFKKFAVPLVSWERLEGEERHGVAHGRFDLHGGLRTHAVEC